MDEIETKRIGRPTRDKWLAFLSKAAELEYITLEEFTERAEMILQAVTQEEIDAVCADLPSRGWNEAWGKLREKGLQPESGIVLKVPRTPVSAITGLLTAFIVCIAIGFTLALLVMR